MAKGTWTTPTNDWVSVAPRPAMTKAQVDLLIQQKNVADAFRHTIATQRFEHDGASGIWGVNNAPKCHTCPLYTPHLSGVDGACLKGAQSTRLREDYGCETHPEIQAVMRLRIEQATLEFAARKIIGGE